MKVCIECLVEESGQWHEYEYGYLCSACFDVASQNDQLITNEQIQSEDFDLWMKLYQKDSAVSIEKVESAIKAFEDNQKSKSSKKT